MPALYKEILEALKKPSPKRCPLERLDGPIQYESDRIGSLPEPLRRLVPVYVRRKRIANRIADGNGCSKGMHQASQEADAVRNIIEEGIRKYVKGRLDRRYDLLPGYRYMQGH